MRKTLEEDTASHAVYPAEQGRRIVKQMYECCGPHGPQGPWAYIFFFVNPVGLQTTFWDFRHLKNLFVSPDRFPNDILGFWTFKNLFW